MIKERLDLTPDLRDLDERVEIAELALRSTIGSALSDQEDVFPQHVMEKVRQRLKRAERKNPAFDKDFYATVEGMLEFSDLQELKDTILAKANWQKFSDVFVSKEDLSKRIDQLAEMRNGIRHSRTIDEISKKDGEAALLWFEKINHNV